MNVCRLLEEFPDNARGGAVAIGNFDGVHLGHVTIIEALVRTAQQIGGPAVVFTFDPHPVRLLRPQQCPPPLTWTERKAELLGRHRVDWMVAYPTDEALLSLSAQDFFQQIVCRDLGARAMVEGSNFFWGRDREGTVDMLRELTSAAGIGLQIVSPLLKAGAVVSSSRIRSLLAAGQVQAARSMLTDPYRVRGMVTHGAGRGAKIGFPTANLEAIDTLLPAVGVYAGRAWVGGDCWPAAINIGPNPTFGEKDTKVEAHLLGRNETLYGEIVELDFLQRLRDIQSFPNAEALVSQLRQDVEQVRAAAESPGGD